MSKIFVHMDKGWPGSLRTKRGGTDGEYIWHIRADHDPRNGAPWSLGMCGEEASLVAFEVRPDVRSIMYMFSRLRRKPGYDVESAPICIWWELDYKEDVVFYIRIGNRTLQAPYFNLPIERQEFIERIEEELDKVFPSEVYSFPHNNWRDIL
ncbi:hypothetical protein Kassivere_00119 [Pseudomonas phage vB_PpuM-Kassivere]